MVGRNLNGDLLMGVARDKVRAKKRAMKKNAREGEEIDIYQINNWEWGGLAGVGRIMGVGREAVLAVGSNRLQLMRDK
jgi:hypothetical protein